MFCSTKFSKFGNLILFRNTWGPRLELTLDAYHVKSSEEELAVELGLGKLTMIVPEVEKGRENAC